MGPVEYAVFRFPGNHFSGEIVPALTELVENGTIRIIDLVFIMKDAEGEVEGFEIEDIPDDVPGLGELTGDALSLLNEEDVELVAEQLPNDCSAALFVFEDVWAERLTSAIRGADGELLASERIPVPVVEAALAALEQDD